ncbi:MAG TPA: DUF2007 domain-containing protein [Thermoanaerobaculaceae bacterium]|nr:DUF2007 domain-containing protein [Thermoanaerobaculaceae bacterium]
MNEAEGEVEVLRVQGAINAEPILAALRANGIPARTRGEALGSVYGLTLDGLGEVAILVPAEHEAAARDLLAAAGREELWISDDEVPGQGNGPLTPDP